MSYLLENGFHAMNEVLIFDEIKPETAKAVAEQLRDKRPATVRINSPGGDLASGLAICSSIQAHGNVTVAAEGVAASAASLPLCVAHRAIAAENAMMMIHGPWLNIAGTANELRGAALALDKFADQIVAMYSRKTRKLANEIKAVLEKGDTWLTALEAKTFGLIDDIGVALPIAACLGARVPPAKIMAAVHRQAGTGFGRVCSDSVTIRQQAEAQFYASPALRAEFGALDIYLAYVLAVARGQTRPRQAQVMMNQGIFK